PCDILTGFTNLPVRDFHPLSSLIPFFCTKNFLFNGVNPVEWFDTNLTHKNKLIIQRGKPSGKKYYTHH
ncbi:MAG: hypothetical protein ACOCYO_10880, partial [Bacteroidota bacterium]